MLVTTPAVPVLCGRCGRWVLTGHAEGLRARLDPVSLSQPHQVLAILLRIPLYRLTRLGPVYLDESRIKSAHEYPVHPGHRHDIQWPVTTSYIPRQPLPLSDTPPF